MMPNQGLGRWSPNPMPNESPQSGFQDCHFSVPWLGGGGLWWCFSHFDHFLPPVLKAMCLCPVFLREAGILCKQNQFNAFPPVHESPISQL